MWKFFWHYFMGVIWGGGSAVWGFITKNKVNVYHTAKKAFLWHFWGSSRPKVRDNWISTSIFYNNLLKKPSEYTCNSIEFWIIFVILHLLRRTPCKLYWGKTYFAGPIKFIYTQFSFMTFFILLTLFGRGGMNQPALFSNVYFSM